MNEHLVSKIINLGVVKLSNSLAIAGVPRLDLDNCESQSDSIRINQRFLKTVERLKWAGIAVLTS